MGRARNYGSDFLRQAFRLLTFVDLPIRKKFILFALGVMFWFLAMFGIAVSTLIGVDRKADTIVGEMIPQDRIAQKVVRNLQSLAIDGTDVLVAESAQAVQQKAEIGRQRIQDTNKLLAALTRGGEVTDYQRESGKLLETFYARAVRGDSGGELYAKEAMVLVAETVKLYEQFATARLEELRGGQRRHGEQSTLMFEAFRGSIQQAIASANEFSAKSGKIYQANSTQIGNAVYWTLLIIAVVVVVALVLLAVFTRWISDSFTRPVESITEQIKELGKGNVDADLAAKLNVNASDEIGILFGAFTELMANIEAMNMFKKVIEEDDRVEDIYVRLGKEFDKIGLRDYRVFEIIDNQNTMRLVYPFGLASEQLFCSPDILDSCMLCRAKKTGHTISSLAYPEMCRHFFVETDREHVCVPMVVGGSTAGVVQFVVERPGSAAAAAEQERHIYKAEQYIKESLSVIEAKRLMGTLRDSSLKDPLTGLHNRRYLQDYTESLVASAQRRGKGLGLIMADLDYFKQVNDTHGHPAGDAVLCQTANLIRKSVRDSDTIIRFGGEEFLIVLLDVAPGEAVEVAEKIRRNIEAAELKLADGHLKKTISSGVAEFPLDCDSFWQAIKFADVALYQAKSRGRNQVVRFDHDMWDGSAEY